MRRHPIDHQDLIFNSIARQIQMDCLDDFLFRQSSTLRFIRPDQPVISATDAHRLYENALLVPRCRTRPQHVLSDLSALGSTIDRLMRRCCWNMSHQTVGFTQEPCQVALWPAIFSWRKRLARVSINTWIKSSVGADLIPVSSPFISDFVTFYDASFSRPSISRFYCCCCDRIGPSQTSPNTTFARTDNLITRPLPA